MLNISMRLFKTAVPLLKTAVPSLTDLVNDPVVIQLKEHLKQGHFHLMMPALKHADLTKEEYSGLLYCAAKQGEDDWVQHFLNRKVNPNQYYTETDNQNRMVLNATATYAATVAGHAGVLELLLKNGGNPNLPSTDSNRIRKPLNVAASLGNTELVKLLLDYRAEVDCPNELKETALSLAASKGYVEIVDILLKKGADVTLKSTQGQDALFYINRNMDLKACYEAHLAERQDEVSFKYY